MILSIVVPMYRVEKYIERCLTSLLIQDVGADEYEIIAVNDGSPDHSAKIARQIAESHSNIRVIDQDNQGLSMARNNGMAVARGEYIWFVDSDDWIAENCLGRLKSILQKETPDILLMCAADCINSTIERRFDYDLKCISNGIDWLRQFKSPCAPFNIWKKSFLEVNGLKFMKGIFHEDSEFTPRAAYLAKRVTAINDLNYVVYHNDQSITRTFNIKRPFDVINHVCTSLADFSANFSNQDKQIFDDLISRNINNALHCTKGATKEQIKQVNEAIYTHRSLIYSLLHSSVPKYRIEGILFSAFPKQYVRIYNLMQKFNNQK